MSELDVYLRVNLQHMLTAMCALVYQHASPGSWFNPAFCKLATLLLLSWVVHSASE